MPPDANREPRGSGATDLLEILAGAGGRTGAIWTLQDPNDLNANLVRFDGGGKVAEHTNDEVDVLFVGIRGSATVRVDGREHALSAGVVVVVAKGSARSIEVSSGGAAYLTVHRRRGLPGIRRPARAR